MYSKIARKTGKKKLQIIDVFRLQFDLVAKEMEKKEGNSVRLPYFATFKVNELRLRDMLNNQQKTNNNEQ